MRTQSTAPNKLNEEQLEGLVQRSRSRDEKAWRALWDALAPLVERMAWSPRVAGRLSGGAEARSDVVIRVMGALREDGFRRLAALGERLACRDGSFLPWLSRLTHDAAVDCVRAHPDSMGRKARRWARRAPLPEMMIDEGPPVSRHAEAHRLLALCPKVLDPIQLDALGLWLAGADAAEIAEALHLEGGAGDAACLVRSALARLRRLTAPRPGNAGSKKSTGAA